MKGEIRGSERRLVVITDPHIKINANRYHVFDEGMELDNTKDSEGNLNSIFVKQPDNNFQFIGWCWPGNSQWVDYLNKGGSEFWAKQYRYDKFKGTDDLFYIWIDMNEPSVFSGDEGTLPKKTRHFLANGQDVLHRDVHNAYGLMMSRATYNGLKQRDDTPSRPFLLTRSAYFGTQKYAAKWTGDNRANIDELKVSLNQLMSLSISGVQFVGADIPGFFGQASDDLFV